VVRNILQFFANMKNGVRVKTFWYSEDQELHEFNLPLKVVYKKFQHDLYPQIKKNLYTAPQSCVVFHTLCLYGIVFRKRDQLYLYHFITYILGVQCKYA